MRALLLPILVPAAVGLLALFVPGRRHAASSAVSVAGAVAFLGAGLAMLDVRSRIALPWLSLGPIDVEFALRADAFSSWAVVFVGVLTCVTALYTAGWWRERGGAPGRHAAFVLIAGAGAATALLADDLLTLIIGWEAVTLALFLASISGRPDAGAGAVKAYTMLGVGDLALILGAVVLGLDRAAAGVAHPWSLSDLASAPVATTHGPAVAVYVLFLISAMAKAGAMPMHSWIPSMSTTTHASIMAFLPGSVDKVLGIYLLARASSTWFVPSAVLQEIVMTLGAITILCGVMMALVQHDLRRLLSFHAVSQVGYMLLGIGTGTVVGAMGGVLHMVNNALYKPCLFLAAGTVERETGTLELGRLGGLGRTMPVTFACMFLASLAIAGVPPLNGFASKWLVYQGCVAAGAPVMLIAALFGSVLTLASFVKVLHSVFWGARPARLDGVREQGGIGIPVAMTTLAGLCVALGVFAGWPLERFVGPALGFERGGASALQGAPATWAPLHGVASPPPFDLPNATYAPLAVGGLLVLGVLLAVGVAYLGAMRSRRVRPAFVGGTTFDREHHRFPGTEFYGTIREVPWLGRAIAVGESGRLDVYEIVRRAGAPVVDLLRRLHTGLLQDYVTWCLIGTAGVLVFFLLRVLSVDAILIGLAVFLLLGSVAALEMRHLLSAVITVGLVGMGLSILFLLLGAPDIAITQIVVEIIVVTVMIRATARTADEETGRPRSAGAIVLGLGSVVLLVLVCGMAFAALPAFGASRSTPSDWYLAEALGVTGASNVVTSIVLDFRGYDTLGEATIILVAVAGALVIARHVEGDGAADPEGPEGTAIRASEPPSEGASHAS